MNCKKIQEIILTDYIDENLNGGVLKVIEGHLEGCAECRRLAEEVRSARVLLGKIKEEVPPAEVWARIKGSIEQKAGIPLYIDRLIESLRYGLPRLRPAVTIAATAVVIIFIITAVRIMPYKSVPGNGAGQEDILSVSYFDQNVDESDYDLDTGAEEYFL